MATARRLETVTAEPPPPRQTAASRQTAPQEGVARISRVTKCFGAKRAIDDVSFELRRAEVLALLGPNGAGKSTLIRLLLGLQKPDGGHALLLDQAPGKLTVQRRIGVMMQDQKLPATLKVREILQLFSSYYPAPYALDVLVELTGVAPHLSRTYGFLSGGEKRLVQFAVAICGRPEILFLDEPTAGLDTEARQSLWKTTKALQARGCSVLLTTHYLEEAEAAADRVVVIANGRLVRSGSVDAIRGATGRTCIRCMSNLDAIDVQAWPQVASAGREGGRLSIVTANGDATLRRLLTQDPRATNVEVRPSTLEEALAEIVSEDRT